MKTTKKITENILRGILISVIVGSLTVSIFKLAIMLTRWRLKKNITSLIKNMKKYWYAITTYTCPFCGESKAYKSRVYEKKEAVREDLDDSTHYYSCTAWNLLLIN